VYECASVARSLRSNLITRHYRFIKRRLNFPFTAFIEPSDWAGRRIRKDRHVSRVQCVSSALVRLLIIVRNRSAKRITNKRAPHSHVRTRRGYHLRSGFRAAIFLASNNRQELAWHWPCVCQQVSIPSSAAARGGTQSLSPVASPPVWVLAISRGLIFSPPPSHHSTPSRRTLVLPIQLAAAPHAGPAPPSAIRGCTRAPRRAGPPSHVMVARNNAECAKVSIARDDGFSCPARSYEGLPVGWLLRAGLLCSIHFRSFIGSCYSANNNGNEKWTGEWTKQRNSLEIEYQFLWEFINRLERGRENR